MSVGKDHDTALFAVESIRKRWINKKTKVYEDVKKLLITTDTGGSNGYRTSLWRYELQKLSDKIGLHILVCHYTPGTNKWNKIEHRMFYLITENWREKPLISQGVVVNLIGSTKTRTGLKTKAKLDLNKYPTGNEVSNEEFLKNRNLKKEISW